MRVPPIVAAALLASSALVAATPAQALVPADVSLTAGPVSSVVSVSPDVFYDEASATYYLYTTGMGTGAPPTPGGPSIGIFSSMDGANWRPVVGASTPSGAYSDPSVVKLPDGSYRMYVTAKAGRDPDCVGKQLRYATSTDLRVWAMQPAVLVEDIGCGVPQVVRTSQGYRLYYVAFGETATRKGQCTVDPDHGVYMRESDDGLVWGAGSSRIAPTDIVDPSVVQLADGSWLMLAADFAQCSTPGFRQQLYAGTSTDGKSWDFGAVTPLYTASTGQGAFDPVAVVLADGTIRAWWSEGTSPDNARVAAGAVTVSVGPDPDPEPVVPVAPSKPTVVTSKAGIKVSWTYAVGAPAPDGYVVQVKTAKAWKAATQVTGTSATVAWAKVGAKKDRAFSVRVVAFIDEATATSPETRAKRPRG